MRILFVYPNLYTQMGFNHGLASLSAVLRRAGHETKLVNLNENLPPVPTDEEVFELVRSWRPGLIGFSCLTMQYAEAVRLAGELRAQFSEGELPPLAVGGIHPTMVPEAVMADGVWDYVGVGECEDALVELAARIEAGERPVDVKNFLSWRDGTRPAEVQAGCVPEEAWIKNPVGEFPAFAGMAMPDYGLFDTQRILEQKQGWFGLMTSRGCPYRCTYCLNHRIVDRYREELGRPVNRLGFLRCRGTQEMIEEIRWVLDHYTGIEMFILDDDLFTMNFDHAIAFSRAYREAGFGIPWVVNSHVKRLAPELARELARGGCRILKLGIESGSERVRREVLERHMSDEDIRQTVRTAEEHGLHTSGFVMVGLPGETVSELFETVELLATSELGRFRTSLFYPFPGTRGHQLSIDGGFVDPRRAGSLTDFTETSCLDFGEEQNLLVEKLARCMPWFVNARRAALGLTAAADRYGRLVERVRAMDRAEWEAFRPGVRGLDSELSAQAVVDGERHYAIRYNAFMGVRSDYFLAEAAGGVGAEWSTAAAQPVPETLRGS